MPVHKIPGGYQYGSSGKKYYGKDAKGKAYKQALAIRLSGYTESGPMPTKSAKSKRKKRSSTDMGKRFVDSLLGRRN